MQEAYAKASNPGFGDNYGSAAAASGNTAVIGAPREWGNGRGANPPADDLASEAGAVYVLVRNSGMWAQQAYVKALNAGTLDQFGFSVAIDGDTLVVGAPYESGNATVVNGADNDLAPSSGAAYVFVRSGVTWTQQAYLKPLNTGDDDFFGWSVSVSGDTVVIGALFEDGSGMGPGAAPDDNAFNAGAAYVFVRNGAIWSQQAYLKASNTGANDWFGNAVAVSGNTAVITAPQEDGNGQGIDPADTGFASNSGASYIFVRNGSTWTQQAQFKAPNNGAFQRFGKSAAIDGDTVVVGADEEFGSGSGVNPPYGGGDYAAGAAYVLKRNGTTWSQEAYLKASNTQREDYFGTSVSVSGDLIAVGAPLEDGGGKGVNPASDEAQEFAGAAYVFGRSGGTWSPLAYVKASNAESYDNFGAAVAISGGTLVVGATGEDGGNAGINPLSNDMFSGAGAAYLFSGFAPPAAAAQPVITSASRSGGSFIIDFTAGPGLTGWRVNGSSNLAGFPDDRTALSSIAELSPGFYRATVSLAGAPAARYFLRIER